MNSFFNFFVLSKDVCTLIITAFAGTIALLTFIKAIFEYRLQGRQKRAELFDKFKTVTRIEPRMVLVNSLLEEDDVSLADIPLIDRYYVLGFYEQISIAVNSNLIRDDVAHYMFGYFAMCCQQSLNFWQGIDKKSYYWSEFNKFADKMRTLEIVILIRIALIKH